MTINKDYKYLFDLIWKERLPKNNTYFILPDLFEWGEKDDSFWGSLSIYRYSSVKKRYVLEYQYMEGADGKPLMTRDELIEQDGYEELYHYLTPDEKSALIKINLSQLKTILRVLEKRSSQLESENEKMGKNQKAS